MVFLKKYKWEIIVFLIALSARLFLLCINLHANHNAIIPTIKGDDGYFEMSNDFLNGHGIAAELGGKFVPSPLRPPAYPVFMASLLFLFHSYFVTILGQMLLGSFIPVLGLLIARELFSERFPQWQNIALWTGIFLALEPLGILLSDIFYTETFFTFFFLFSVLYFFRYFKVQSYKNILMSSVLLAVATLAKPTVQYVPIFASLFILFHWRRNLSKKICLQAAAFALLFLVILTPWLYRNYRQFGVVGMSAQVDYNLYVYLVPSVLAVEKGTDFQTELNGYVRNHESDPGMITLSNGAYYKDQAVSVLKQHPEALIKLCLISLFTFFTHDGMLVVIQHAGYPINVGLLSKPALMMLIHSPGKFFIIIKNLVFSPYVLVGVFRLLWILAFLLGIVTLVDSIRNKWCSPQIVSAVFLLAYFALTTMINGLGVNERFRVPVNAFIISFALCGFVLLKDKVSKKFS